MYSSEGMSNRCEDRRCNESSSEFRPPNRRNGIGTERVDGLAISGEIRKRVGLQARDSNF